MIYICYHAPCSDGFGAAYAAYRYFGQRTGSQGVEFVPLAYGEELPFRAWQGDKVYFLDVTLSTEATEDLLHSGATVVVIDHHKTAFENLGNMEHPLLTLILDNDKSGAVLSWEHFNWHEEVPEALLYIQDRDLWNWELPHSRPINAALSSYPMEFEIWDDLLDMGVAKLRHEGDAIVRFQQAAVDQVVFQSHVGLLAGHEIRMVNCASRFLISDVGNKLLDEYPEIPFAAVYRYYESEKGDLECGWSLRSRGDFDVTEVARQFGGGGHAAAAGFREELGGHLGL